MDIKTFKELNEVSAETKAKMKVTLNRSYAAQLKTKLSNAVSSMKELAFDLDNKVQTVDPTVSKQLKAFHKELNKFAKQFNKAVQDKVE
jgi:hypothetical protein